MAPIVSTIIDYLTDFPEMPTQVFEGVVSQGFQGGHKEAADAWRNGFLMQTANDWQEGCGERIGFARQRELKPVDSARVSSGNPRCSDLRLRLDLPFNLAPRLPLRHSQVV